MLAHEGYPGHLYQSAYFNDREPVPVRRLLACGGYNEGWGLYSELYAYSFDNGLPEAVKPLMRCSEASSYGLYALLDICIHYDGWDLATTTSYLENSYGFTDPESAREIYLAIIDNPGNSPEILYRLSGNPDHAPGSRGGTWKQIQRQELPPVHPEHGRRFLPGHQTVFSNMADDGEITRIREKERSLPVCIRILQRSRSFRIFML